MILSFAKPIVDCFEYPLGRAGLSIDYPESHVFSDRNRRPPLRGNRKSSSDLRSLEIPMLECYFSVRCIRNEPNEVDAPVYHELPKEIAFLVDLIELNLSRNRLEHLPMEIGKLSKLSVLVLARNRLIELPKTIGQLGLLEKLELQWNRITDLPDEITKLKNLKRLELTRNRLTFLPATIGNLKNLEYLEASHNELVELPSSIGGLVNLKDLEVEYNYLKSIPSDIGKLRRLVEAGFNGNQISSVPNTFRSLKNLESISFSHNRIKKVPSCFMALTKLKHLHFYDNEISRVPLEIGGLENLDPTYGLWFEENPIIDPPPNITDQGSIRLLEYLRKEYRKRTARVETPKRAEPSASVQSPTDVYDLAALLSGALGNVPIKTISLSEFSKGGMASLRFKCEFVLQNKRVIRGDISLSCHETRKETII